MRGFYVFSAILRIWQLEQLDSCATISFGKPSLNIIFVFFVNWSFSQEILKEQALKKRKEEKRLQQEKAKKAEEKRKSAQVSQFLTLRIW